MAEVTVTKSGDTIYFRSPIQSGSKHLAEYLNLLVNRTATVAAIATLEGAAAQVDGQGHGRHDCTRTKGILRTHGQIG